MGPAQHEGDRRAGGGGGWGGGGNTFSIESSKLPITRAALANQKVTNNTLSEKPEDWPACLARKLKHSNRAEDPWFQTVEQTKLLST